MVFQGEDVPLTEDILKKKVEFIPTKSEWSGENKTIIRRSGSSTTSFDLYAVPTNRTLFITSCFLGMNGTNSDAVNPQFASIDIQGQGGSLLRFNIPASASMDMFESLSFTMPMKVESGDIVRAFIGNAGYVTTAGIIGWEESKLIS